MIDLSRFPESCPTYFIGGADHGTVIALQMPRILVRHRSGCPPYRAVVTWYVISARRRRKALSSISGGRAVAPDVAGGSLWRATAKRADLWVRV